jgi:hypothetical protein
MNLVDFLRAHTGCWLAVSLFALLMRITGIHMHLDRAGGTVTQSLHWYDSASPEPETPAAASLSHVDDIDVCLMTDALVRGAGHIMVDVAAFLSMLAALWALLGQPPPREAPPGAFEHGRWTPPPRLYWRLPPLRAPPR